MCSIKLVKNVASLSSALTNTLPKIRACTANGIFVATPTATATTTPVRTTTATPTATIAPTTVPVTNLAPKITGIQSLDVSVNPPQYINNFGYSGQYIVLYGDFKENGNTLLSNFDASITYQSKKQINIKLNSLVQTGVAYFIITNEFGSSERVELPIFRK